MISKQEVLDRCNSRKKGTLMETLDITFVDVDFEDQSITAKMPVTKAVHQPDGVLHGGATAALIETVGSVAVFVFKQTENWIVRGIEISANHLKSIREGDVFATAKPVHLGRTTQHWEIKVTDKEGALISIGKLLTITLEKK
ncbi:MAG: thioesterase [Bacteroidetes bacterium]|jgi:1,4-dihydroxy-2-naphthoyl-CoA hydrolase|nr:MAG: thioesterase [Bacteroidota bacterium]